MHEQNVVLGLMTVLSIAGEWQHADKSGDLEPAFEGTTADDRPMEGYITMGCTVDAVRSIRCAA